MRDATTEDQALLVKLILSYLNKLVQENEKVRESLVGASVSKIKDHEESV